jgi:hypothetical protein
MCIIVSEPDQESRIVALVGNEKDILEETLAGGNL